MSKTSPQVADESLAVERRAFERQRVQLMRRFPGEYVALSGGRVVDHDNVLTPAEAERLRESLEQTRQGNTRPWAEIKPGLGL